MEIPASEIQSANTSPEGMPANADTVSTGLEFRHPAHRLSHLVMTVVQGREKADEWHRGANEHDAANAVERTPGQPIHERAFDWFAGAGASAAVRDWAQQRATRAAQPREDAPRVTLAMNLQAIRPNVRLEPRRWLGAARNLGARAVKSAFYKYMGPDYPRGDIV